YNEKPSFFKEISRNDFTFRDRCGAKLHTLSEDRIEGKRSPWAAINHTEITEGMVPNSLCMRPGTGGRSSTALRSQTVIGQPFRHCLRYSRVHPVARERPEDGMHETAIHRVLF